MSIDEDCPPPARPGLPGLLLVAGAAATCCLCPPGVAYAEAINAEGGSLETIRRAIVAAQPGDLIEVAAGTYFGQLLIDKPLILSGSGEVQLTGSGTGSVITVSAAGVELTGLNVTGSGSDLLALDAGIRIEADGCRVADCHLDSVLYGIVVVESDGVVLECNTVTGAATLPLAAKGSGFQLNGCNDARVSHNTISGMRDGVYFDNCSGCQTKDNEIYGLRYALHYMFCGANSFDTNRLYGNISGAAIMYSSGVTFNGNQMYDNRGAYMSFGLLFKDARDCSGSRNAIFNNVTGIMSDDSSGNAMNGNLLAYNDTAIRLSGVCADTLYSGNDFIGNGLLLLAESGTTAEWSGNYYSDYAGYDLDGDSIGEVAHALQNPAELAISRNPAASLYAGSPAVSVLARLDRSFPALTAGSDQDREPAIKPVSTVTADDSRQYPAERSGLHALAAGLFLTASIFMYLRVAR